MKTVIVLALALAAPSLAAAEDALEMWRVAPQTVFDAADIDLSEFKWHARPLVVFADTPEDPRFVRQMELLSERPADLAERDVVIITDTDPAGASSARKSLRPRGFMLTLLAKDGSVAFRKPSPWDLREISRAIDKMPLRQQEIQERRLSPQ